MQPLSHPANQQDAIPFFNRVLNLQLLGELTGDWHFKVAFFCDPSEPPRIVSLVGEGQPFDTNPVLDDLGVRDMSSILEAKEISASVGTIYVATIFELSQT